MRIAVCVKQVPDTEAQMRIRSDGRWIEEEKEPILGVDRVKRAILHGLDQIVLTDRSDNSDNSHPFRIRDRTCTRPQPLPHRIAVRPEATSQPFIDDDNGN